jgi:hypothetical protein
MQALKPTVPSSRDARLACELLPGRPADLARRDPVRYCSGPEGAPPHRRSRTASLKSEKFRRLSAERRSHSTIVSGLGIGRTSVPRIFAAGRRPWVASQPDVRALRASPYERPAPDSSGDTAVHRTRPSQTMTRMPRGFGRGWDQPCGGAPARIQIREGKNRMVEQLGGHSELGLGSLATGEFTANSRRLPFVG